MITSRKVLELGILKRGPLKSAVFGTRHRGYNFPEELDFDGPFENPLFNAVNSRDASRHSNVVAEIFAEELDYALVSFIFVLDAAGEVLHCTSSFEDYGVDPCFEGAVYNLSTATDKPAIALGQ